ncbi:MAG TPA: hypothetical protein VG297_21770 [Bryobacteraceae bacterium]|jgi:hypothetical protein|nr:hypothetical protein [Bryobacteraceae bacterium]
MDSGVALWGFLSVGAFGLFLFLTVASWSESHRREREAYYKNEAIRKLAEASPEMAAAGLDFLREMEKNDRDRVLAQIRIGGLVTCGVGIGVTIFLAALIRDAPIYLSGLIPLLVGAALLAWSYVPGLRE